MIARSLNEIVRIAGGQLVGENRTFGSVSTDTRT